MSLDMGWRYDWDRQIESDAKSGKLYRMTDRALLDHEAGRSAEL